MAGKIEPRSSPSGRNAATGPCCVGSHAHKFQHKYSVEKYKKCEQIPTKHFSKEEDKKLVQTATTEIECLPGFGNWLKQIRNNMPRKYNYGASDV